MFWSPKAVCFVRRDAARGVKSLWRASLACFVIPWVWIAGVGCEAFVERASCGRRDDGMKVVRDDQPIHSIHPAPEASDQPGPSGAGSGHDNCGAYFNTTAEHTQAEPVYDVVEYYSENVQLPETERDGVAGFLESWFDALAALQLYVSRRQPASFAELQAFDFEGHIGVVDFARARLRPFLSSSNFTVAREAAAIDDCLKRLRGVIEGNRQAWTRLDCALTRAEGPTVVETWQRQEVRWSDEEDCVLASIRRLRKLVQPAGQRALTTSSSFAISVVERRDIAGRAWRDLCDEEVVRGFDLARDDAFHREVCALLVALRD
jgi:hypothetical protein